MKVVTKLAQEIPKGVKPYRSVKGTTHMGGKYVVRVIDERAREGSSPGFGGHIFWEVMYVTKPTLSLAWYLPNNFEADWKGLRIGFRVDRIKAGRQSRWAITSLTVEPLKEGKAIEDFSLPLSIFLKEAINLAGVQCITFPPGFEGDLIDEHGNPLPNSKGWRIKVPATQKEGELWVSSWLDETPKSILKSFVATATKPQEQKRLTSAKRLKIVAKAWRSAPPRQKSFAVQQALEAEGDFVGLERIKQLIEEARKEGLIPPSTRSKK